MMKYKLDEVKNLASGIDHSEGICLGVDGNLYLGGEAGQIYRLTLEGELREVAHLKNGGILLGLTACLDGRLIVCDPGGKCLWKVNLENNTWEVFVTSSQVVELQTPNWGAFLPDGSYVFSDSGNWKGADGFLVRVLPNKEIEKWSGECPNFPNGLALSEDGMGIYVLESTPGLLSYFPILKDGSSGAKQIICEIPGVPDGVTVAKNGHLIISCYRPDTIYVWSKDKGLEVLIEDPEGTVVAAPTNTVLTGAGNRDLIWPNFARWNVAKLETSYEGISILSF
jgi:gluconolactonase